MFLNDDDMVECPYNKTHRMLRKRLQSHLLKCRLNYPDVELRKCPFNITHLIPEPEFAHHATNCPDRKLITQYKYDAPEQKEEEIPKHAPIECDENWDDTDVNDYNPRLYLDRANVIRQPDGANRSERKLFIKKERKRLGDGDVDDDSSDEESRGGFSLPGNKREPNDTYDDRSDGEGRDDRSKRSASPSTSLYSRERSRSPKNKFKRNRSRSPTTFKGKKVGKNATNNQFNSGRDPYYSSNNYHAYYDRDMPTDNTMPQAPPPPMISYPAPRAYLSTKPSPASDH